MHPRIGNSLLNGELGILMIAALLGMGCRDVANVAAMETMAAP